MEPSDLIFNRDPTKGIYSGGFSIKNYFLNNGISPITTLNQQGGSTNNKVSDLFNNLVVPASLYYKGGSVSYNRKRSTSNNDDEHEDVAFKKSEQNFVPHGGKAPVNPPFPPLFPKVDFQKGDEETDVVDDHLYNELLKMVSGENKIEKRKTRRLYKKSIRQKSRKSK